MDGKRIKVLTGLTLAFALVGIGIVHFPGAHWALGNQIGERVMERKQDKQQERDRLNRPPDKGHNRLIFEKSPYLLQHADNPVDWYPWGPEAFEKANPFFCPSDIQRATGAT
jgi:hypothetical protein